MAQGIDLRHAIDIVICCLPYGNICLVHWFSSMDIPKAGSVCCQILPETGKDVMRAPDSLLHHPPCALNLCHGDAAILQFSP